MKYLIAACLLGLSLASKAQFVVGNTTLTIRNGATFSIGGLVLQPTADLTIQNNELQRIETATPVGSRNSIGRVYLFSSPVNYSGTIGFQYEDTDLGGKAEDNLSLFYSSQPDGNTWQPGSGGAVDIDANYVSAIVPGENISRITASEAGALPVTLIEFTARENAAEKAALLAWKVANEVDFKAYTVERSPDAKTFTSLTNIPAAGSSNYHFTDTRPLEGNNYYRLKMEDLDGSFTYSGIRVLTFGKPTPTLYLYPNPADGEYVTIAASALPPDNMPAAVLDINGRVMYSTQLGGARTKINVSGWQAGVYVVRLGDGTVLRFVKP